MTQASKPDLSPKTQGDQPEKGAIDKAQVTDATMRERDLARGSEPAARGASRGR